MSLVVAQVTEDGPRIVSDTRVTYMDNRRKSFKTGTLKSIVISRELAVSFAGDVDCGLGAVREFARLVVDGIDPEQVTQVLVRKANECRGAVDFIVAMAAPGSGLVQIKNGSVQRDLLTAWIGDAVAFEKFQSTRNRPSDPQRAHMLGQLPQSAQVTCSLGDAMRAVIADPEIESVGDFCVTVASRLGAFNYFPETFIHLGRDISLRDGDDLISRLAQPVEEGGYAVSIVEPANPGTPALGLNFPRARLGMLYSPLAFDEAQVVDNVSPNDFATVIRERYGIELSMPMLRTK